MIHPPAACMTYEEYPGNLWQLDLQPRPTPLESSMLAINSSSDSIFSRPAKNHRKLRQVTYSSIKRRQRMPLCCILHIDMRRHARKQSVSAPFLFSKTFLVVLLALFFCSTTKCRMPWSLWISSSESEDLSHDFNLLAFLHLWDLLLRFIPKSHC